MRSRKPSRTFVKDQSKINPSPVVKLRGYGENLEREVFLSDATTDESVAASIRELLKQKKDATTIQEKKKIEGYLSKIREDCGVMVNVSNSTVIYRKRGVKVIVNGVWKDKDGEQYSMICTLEDWLNFGKPFTAERRHSPLTGSGVSAKNYKPPKYKSSWD